MDLREVDKKISEATGRIDFYSCLTPLNQKEEEEKFFLLFEKGEKYNPVFKYKEHDLAQEKKDLEELLKGLDAADPLHGVFIKKIEFILTQAELLEASDEDFAQVAVKLHGEPDKETIDTALGILREGRDTGYVFPDETVTPEEMCSILSEDLKEAGIDWKCTLSRKLIPKVTVSGKDRTIYVNDRISYTQEEIERLRIHEIKVHIYRGANGAIQPFHIFAEGLAGYNETEEGLAIVAEERTGVLKEDTRQMKLYSGRAVCVHHSLEKGFYEVFDALREFFPDRMAYRLAERGKRGLVDTSSRGGLTKGFHYISGWQKVKRFVEENGDLSILYVGKIGVDDVGAARELLSGGVLKAPEHLPEFI
ncbi:tyrosine/phenylalanine carboxypeptidase domain-containing protein [Candidatus Omnitrophota bacterium]